MHSLIQCEIIITYKTISYFGHPFYERNNKYNYKINITTGSIKTTKLTSNLTMKDYWTYSTKHELVLSTKTLKPV
jgi:hypothetical protein